MFLRIIQIGMLRVSDYEIIRQIKWSLKLCRLRPGIRRLSNALSVSAPALLSLRSRA